MRKPKLKREKKQPKLEPWKQAKLLTLVEEWTRYEIAARLLPIETKLAVDYYRRMLEKEDEIRELLYGSSNLNQLAKVLGMDKSTHKDKLRKLRSASRTRTTHRTHVDRVDVDDDIEAILREAGVE